MCFVPVLKSHIQIRALQRLRSVNIRAWEHSNGLGFAIREAIYREISQEFHLPARDTNPSATNIAAFKIVRRNLNMGILRSLGAF
jgi:hypothetical protein